MKLENLTEQQKKVLKDIQNSIPSEWINKSTHRVLLAPATKEILERALLDDEVEQSFKDEAKIILDSGVLDKEIDEEVEEVTALIDAYVEKEILKAVIAKKLPPLKKKRSFEHAFRKFNQLKANYERNQKRSN